MSPSKFPAYLLANILAALLVGYLLDYWFHTKPVFIIIGVLYAIFGSLYLLIWHEKKKNG